MRGDERKWLTLAVVLSLIVSLLILFPVIGMIGVSPIGSMAIKEGSVTAVANATFWTIHSSTYASFGISVVPVILLVALLVAGIMFAATFKAFGED